MAQSMQRGAHYLLILTNMLRTLDANHVSYSPTRARFVVLAGLINIELLGLQDGYLVGETTNVNYEWEAVVNESSVEGQGDGDVTFNC
jgi:hypothetical protein